MEDKLVRVVVLSSRFEADLVEDALKREGVPHLIQGYEETAYNGIFIPQKGWGALLVPEGMKKTALAVIEPLLKSLARSDIDNG